VVVAHSFARIFYRNGFNMGLVLLEVGDDYKKLGDGDQLEVDTASGVIHNLATGESVQCAPVPAFMQTILDAGGLVEYGKKKLG
ncbi:MAG: 3-isopropylmalate dehydratase small subunit, partial [Desulfovibrionaceae bacterium]